MKCRTAVLATIGVIVCTLAWMATSEIHSHAANIGKLSAVLEKSPGLQTASTRLVIANRGAGEVKLMGATLQFKEWDGSWTERSVINSNLWLKSGRSYTMMVNGIKQSGDYRAQVGYYGELTGPRLWGHRLGQVLKKKSLSELSRSGTPYLYGEVTAAEVHF